MDRLIKSMKPGKIVALHRINAAHAEYIQMRDWQILESNYHGEVIN